MDKKAKALLEACLVVLVATILIWLFEVHPFGMVWTWLGKGSLLLLTLLAIALPGRSLKAYGIVPLNPTFTLKWSFVFFTVFIVPAIVAIGVSSVLGIADLGKLSIGSLLVNITWALVATGFVEEALFRGYVQTRLEQVYGKKWDRLVFKSWRVSYGLGLLIASLIFGIAHIVEYWNPLVSRLAITPFTLVHIFWAFVVGVLLGALREASGDIYVSVFLHGGLNTAVYMLLATANVVLLNIVMFTGFFLFFYILDKYFNEAVRVVHRK